MLTHLSSSTQHREPKPPMLRIPIRIANISNPLPRILQMPSQNCRKYHFKVHQEAIVMQIIPIQTHLIREDNFIIVFDWVHISPMSSTASGIGSTSSSVQVLLKYNYSDFILSQYIFSIIGRSSLKVNFIFETSPSTT